MRRSLQIVCALLVTTSYGCDKVKKQVDTVRQQVAQQVDVARQRFLKKKTGAHPVPAAPVAPAPAQVTTPAPSPQATGRKTGHAAPPPAPVPTQQLASNRPRRRDEPYVSTDTGTVFPGMAERDVYSLWGPPVAVRHLGDFTYLYFKNGCEYSCGHLDVVTLQNGQVVDALVRWPGHGYAGQSNSPSATPPEAPPGGNILQIAPPPPPPPAAADSTSGMPAPVQPAPAPVPQGADTTSANPQAPSNP